MGFIKLKLSIIKLLFGIIKLILGIKPTLKNSNCEQSKTFFYENLAIEVQINFVISNLCSNNKTNK